MYGNIVKLNATGHPFNRQFDMDPDVKERLGVMHAVAQREAKDAIKALESE